MIKATVALIQNRKLKANVKGPQPRCRVIANIESRTHFDHAILPTLKKCYKVFSLTWPAFMQIYWGKGKGLHKSQNGRRFIVLGHQYGRCDVM